MRIVLVGYRGTGKSTVGRILGRTLSWEVLSSDAEISARAGKSIPEIVEAHGWEVFRDLEEETIRDLVHRTHVVLDCGGGVVERRTNIDRLLDAGPVVWLSAPPSVIVERIANNNQRPSLTGTKSFTDEVEEVLQRRGPLYDRVSDYRVETEGKVPEEIALEVMEMVADEIEHTALRSLRS